jgi:hypothetical protein
MLAQNSPKDRQPDSIFAVIVAQAWMQSLWFQEDVQDRKPLQEVGD